MTKLRHHSRQCREFHLWATLTLLAAGLGGSTAVAAEEIQGPSYWGSFEPASEPGPDILHDSSAVFSWEGNRYALYATHSPAASARQVLESAIATLAPGLGLECFHRLTSGSWSDLAAAGIGDPRGAVPADWIATEMELTYYASPLPACPVSAVEVALPVSFSAGFDHWSGQLLRIRAESRQDGAGDLPGLISGSDAEWSHGGLAFGVAFDGGKEGLVTAVARALDPSFEEACHRRSYELSDAQLPAHRFKAPVAPAGFQELFSKKRAKLSPGGCSKGAPDPGEFELEWVFASEAGQVLEIGAERRPESGVALNQDPDIGDDSVRWTDPQGTSYHVYGHSLDDGPGLEMAKLFEVARSLDPSVVLPPAGNEP